VPAGLESAEMVRAMLFAKGAADKREYIKRKAAAIVAKDAEPGVEDN
tara:strand:- start:1882 stop:2022 length:141 start_codon:yes stop_codon:yes gene_type:complete